MSDEALKDAKIKALEDEKRSFQNIVNNFSGTIRAQKAALEEFLQANIGLKSSLILLEERQHALNKDLSMFSERINVLENEKKDLIQKIKDLDLASQDAA